MDFAYNLRRYRKKKGLSQAELARLAGVAEVSIRKYEAGERFPKLETRLKLAKALDVSPYYLSDNLFSEKKETSLDQAADKLLDKLGNVPGVRRLFYPQDDLMDELDFYDKEFPKETDKHTAKYQLLITPESDSELDELDELLRELIKLNSIGRKEVLKKIKELSKIAEYVKTTETNE